MMRTATDELITPDVAKQWLSESKTRNRPVNKAVVARYKKEMLAGSFEDTGVPIIFDCDGNIIDGQHRLHACVESGCSFPSLVVRGSAPHVFRYIDIGAPRTAGQMVRILGHSNGQDLVAAAHWLMRYESKKESLAPEMHKTEVFAFFEANESRIISSFEHAKVVPRTILSAPIACALLCILSEIDTFHAHAFFEKLSSGASLVEGHPVLVLRNQMLKSFSNSGNKSLILGAYRFALAIKAWNAYRRGGSIKMLRWQDGENFPTAR